MTDEAQQEALTPVVSSNIRAYGYTPGEKKMIIEFTNGSKYEYADVPSDVVNEFAKAESIGRYFGASIRGKFQCTKVEHHDEEET